MAKLILYTRPVCHLCDQAEELLEEVAPRLAATLERVDIEQDPQLTMRYGLQIPVFRRVDDGEELGWPFDDEQLLAFLRPLQPVH
jgi:hypothetical protein